MDRKRVRVRVWGRVQGVWFRGSTQDKALSLGLTGWVRNMVDGTVQLEAEGTPDSVDQLVKWCQKGPPGARVDHLETEALEPTAAEPTFQVSY